MTFLMMKLSKTNNDTNWPYHNPFFHTLIICKGYNHVCIQPKPTKKNVV